MQHDRHNFFTQNCALMNHSRKKWACLPSKALFAKDVRGTENVGRLQSMIKTISNKKVVSHQDSGENFSEFLCWIVGVDLPARNLACGRLKPHKDKV